MVPNRSRSQVENSVSHSLHQQRAESWLPGSLSTCQPAMTGFVPYRSTSASVMRSDSRRYVAEVVQVCLREPYGTRVPRWSVIMMSGWVCISQTGGVAVGVPNTMPIPASPTMSTTVSSHSQSYRPGSGSILAQANSPTRTRSSPRSTIISMSVAHRSRGHCSGYQHTPNCMAQHYGVLVCRGGAGHGPFARRRRSLGLRSTDVLSASRHAPSALRSVSSRYRTWGLGPGARNMGCGTDGAPATVSPGIGSWRRSSAPSGRGVRGWRPRRRT